MRLVAFDIETTGTDPQKDQILEIGAVCFEAQTGEVVGEFERLVRHSRYSGDPYALQMNAGLLKRLADGEGTGLTQALVDLRNALTDWGFDSDNKPIAVGFNVGKFDLAFLNTAYGKGFFSHRTIELGSLLMSPVESLVPVSSRGVATALGLEDMPHTAVADAEIARKAYVNWLAWVAGGKPTLAQMKSDA